MRKQGDVLRWLLRSRLKQSVLLGLRKPMPIVELWHEVHQSCPGIERTAVSRFIAGFLEKNILLVLNTNSKKGSIGNLYWFTPYGKRLVEDLFHITLTRIDRNINWNEYTRILRATARQHILTSMRRLEAHSVGPKHSSQIREAIGQDQPVQYCIFIRAFRSLLRSELVQCVGHFPDKRNGLYILTDKGRQVADQLML